MLRGHWFGGMRVRKGKEIGETSGNGFAAMEPVAVAARFALRLPSVPPLPPEQQPLMTIPLILVTSSQTSPLVEFSPDG